jgi:hypothetical protein
VRASDGRQGTAVVVGARADAIDARRSSAAPPTAAEARCFGDCLDPELVGAAAGVRRELALVTRGASARPDACAVEGRRTIGHRAASIGQRRAPGAIENRVTCDGRREGPDASWPLRALVAVACKRRQRGVAADESSPSLRSVWRSQLNAGTLAGRW